MPIACAIAAQREHQRDGPQRDVEAADRVVRVDPRPARRRGAHEVASHVVAHGHAGEPGHLRRVARHQLERDPDVQRRVHVLAEVEPERAGLVDAVHAVLRQGEQQHQHADGRRRAAQRGPRRARVAAAGSEREHRGRAAAPGTAAARPRRARPRRRERTRRGRAAARAPGRSARGTGAGGRCPARRRPPARTARSAGRRSAGPSRRPRRSDLELLRHARQAARAGLRRPARRPRCARRRAPR